MASLQTIAKAKATGLILKNLLGTEPNYEYFDNYIRIYYKPDQLKNVHGRIDQIALNSAKSSDIKIDLLPIVAPIAVKKILPFAIGAIVTGYLLGKML